MVKVSVNERKFLSDLLRKYLFDVFVTSHSCHQESQSYNPKPCAGLTFMNGLKNIWTRIFTSTTVPLLFRPH
jgi:hypothetical protein